MILEADKYPSLADYKKLIASVRKYKKLDLSKTVAVFSSKLSLQQSEVINDKDSHLFRIHASLLPTKKMIM